MVHGLETIARLNSEPPPKPAMPLVYISSPFTKGLTLWNIRAAADAFHDLIEFGMCVPISPVVMTSLADIAHPRSWESWMAYDIELLRKCDVIVRIDAVIGEYVQRESRGADFEMKMAESIGIYSFHGIPSLKEWLRG